MRKFSVFITIVLLFSSCQLSRFVFYNFADIKDYKKFPKRDLIAPENKFIFHSSSLKKLPDSITVNGKRKGLEKYMEENKTVAFLIIQNDSIYYEKYFKGYNQTSIVPSFSMAKSITSILIGCAIDDGLIQSVNEPITNYIPELKDNGMENLTIESVLQMTSGIEFKESYFNPFGHAAAFYYGRNLPKKIDKLKMARQPETKFEYVSGNTQLLGLILERALKNKTITDYFNEKLWQPLGMEYDASWSIDQKKNGLEKTFCCVNARARDFAKIGRLYLNNGNWNGKQIVSSEWVKNSTKIDTTKGSAWYYQYQWWLPNKTGDFMAEGILGQFIYVNPSKNLIIVRLGKNNGEIPWSNFFPKLAERF